MRMNGILERSAPSVHPVKHILSTEKAGKAAGRCPGPRRGQRLRAPERHAGEIIPPAPPCFRLAASPVGGRRLAGEKRQGASPFRREESMGRNAAFPLRFRTASAVRQLLQESVFPSVCSIASAGRVWAWTRAFCRAVSWRALSAGVCCRTRLRWPTSVRPSPDRRVDGRDFRMFGRTYVSTKAESGRERLPVEKAGAAERGWRRKDRYPRQVSRRKGRRRQRIRKRAGSIPALHGVPVRRSRNRRPILHELRVRPSAQGRSCCATFPPLRTTGSSLRAGAECRSGCLPDVAGRFVPPRRGGVGYGSAWSSSTGFVPPRRGGVPTCLFNGSRGGAARTRGSERRSAVSSEGDAQAHHELVDVVVL